VTKPRKPLLTGGPTQTDTGGQGDFLTPDGDNPFSDAQEGDNPYRENNIDTRYEYDSGWRVNPVAGPDGTASDAVKLHAARWKKVVRFDFERDNQRPNLPHPGAVNDNQLLTYGTVVVAAPLYGPGGETAWRASGVYVYELGKPLPEWGPFSVGTTPDVTTQPTLTAYQTTDFVGTFLADDDGTGYNLTTGGGGGGGLPYP
jgi:hypothetical protein